MKLDIYVNYKNKCREAFAFYEQRLGGKLISMQTFGEMYGASLPPGLGKDDIIHARIEIGGSVVMGADIAHAEPMRSAYLTLTFDNVEEAEEKYGILSEGGEIFMPMKQTEFAERFAMLRDRFGASWMLLCQK
jgi:PhnB protein